MSDITKIREWLTLDGTERVDEDGLYDWPAPPSNIESVVTGELRAHILAKLGRSADDEARVTIVESAIEGGHSEWTSEMDYEIEVWVRDGAQSQRVFQRDGFSEGRPMQDFLAWAAPTSPEQP